jgi:hypothetical protein
LEGYTLARAHSLDSFLEKLLQIIVAAATLREEDRTALNPEKVGLKRDFKSVASCSKIPTHLEPIIVKVKLVERMCGVLRERFREVAKQVV